ncbi:MAG: flagellar basal body protein [Nitrospira sp.]|nr:flagellar basal body protein [Nitrospira sp.]
MISAIYTALSGLTAFAQQLNVSAYNLANLNTDNFKRSETQFVEARSGGVFPVIQHDNSPGPTVLRHSPQGMVPIELSNVDIAMEFVNQMVAQRGFEANLRTMNTADDMVGSILDTRK